jgi:hypothetical protein
MEISTNATYEAALKPHRPLMRRILSTIWLVVGAAGLIAFAWAEPWSAQFADYLLSAGVPGAVVNFIFLPLVMFIRAVILVESFGYVYHRFFQHVGWLTRRAQVIRRNQRFHWIHHMVIYPIGRFYKRTHEYISSEKGVGLSWVLPGIIVSAIFLVTHGLSFSTALFILGVGLYAKFVVDLTHSRFHEEKHPWVSSEYFHWLEEIHLLHHWDQRYNFTIVHPAMDFLFGTYLSPSAHQNELKAALEDKEFSVSDVINWRYLLLEATPAERAVFVSTAERHARTRRKIAMLLEVLAGRLTAHPEDAEAKLLHDRALEVQRLCPARTVKP